MASCCASSEDQPGGLPRRTLVARFCLHSAAWNAQATLRREWRATENNRRAKYYMLTAKGRKALDAETQQWQRQTAAISRILEA